MTVDQRGKRQELGVAQKGLIGGVTLGKSPNFPICFLRINELAPGTMAHGLLNTTSQPSGRYTWVHLRFFSGKSLQVTMLLLAGIS